MHDSSIEQQIREAQARGDFDRLPGAGRPIAHLDDLDDELWWVRQWLKREGVTVLPPALAMRREVEDLPGVLARIMDEAAVRMIVEEVNRRIVDLNSKPTDGPPSTVSRLDVEALVVRWRQERTDQAATVTREASGPTAAPPPPGEPRRRRRHILRTARWAR